jgi:hypothetical protein
MLSSTKSCADGKMPGFLKCNKYRGNRKNGDVVIEHEHLYSVVFFRSAPLWEEGRPWPGSTGKERPRRPHAFSSLKQYKKSHAALFLLLLLTFYLVTDKCISTTLIYNIFKH